MYFISVGILLQIDRLYTSFIVGILTVVFEKSYLPLQLRDWQAQPYEVWTADLVPRASAIDYMGTA